MIFNPWPYQKRAEQHLYDNSHSGLFLDMGLGKTVITETVLANLIAWCEIDKVLVIAPKRVAETVWEQEAKKWEHLKHLRFSKVIGTVKQRIEALKVSADIYIIGVDNVTWLIDFYKSKFPFKCLVIDELSKFKNRDSIRFRKLKMVRLKLTRIIGLTGTPAPNGLIDIWSQLYLLDGGERLGTTIGYYRDTYFNAGSRDGYIVHKYQIKKNAAKVIYNKIGDICISMRSKDYLKMPKRVENLIKLDLPKQIMQQYEEFERDQVMQLKDEEITAVNAAVLTGKLLQFANGAIYNDKHIARELHTVKLDALEELIDEAQSEPMLIAYSFRHDRDRIMKRFKVRELKGDVDVQAWNSGDVPVMIAHPASAGHGLNLQYGGHVLTWFSPNWSLELDQQFNTRLDRQGQKKVVILNRLLVNNTMDFDVYKAVGLKEKGQDSLLEAIKAKIKKYS